MTQLTDAKFDYNSLRARKARLVHLFTVPLRLLLWLLIICAIAGGVYLIYLKNPLGWFVASLCSPLVVLLAWRKEELVHLPTGKGNTINDILSGNCLGLLPNNPTPQDIAKIITKTRSGAFLASRFGISAGFLDNLSSIMDGDPTKIWQKAEVIREETNSPQIAGAILAVAIIESFPDYESLLARMQLEVKDLYGGIEWYNYLHGLIKQASLPKRTGGIARDWVFGYTPLLSRFGQNISQQISAHPSSVHLTSHFEGLEKMLSTFGVAGRQNITLVGAQGCGKSTLVYAFAQKLLDAKTDLPPSLKFRQVFILDSSAIISAAPGRGELENLVTKILNEAYRAKNIIICLDNAQLFLEEGVGSVDLSNILLPVLEAGALRVILTMDEQRLLQISQRNPALLNTLNRVVVEPTTREETLRIMQDKAPELEYKQKVFFMYQALGEAYRLSERYIHGLAMPGRALNLLEAAASYPENGKIITANSVQRAIEKTLGVKVSVAQGALEQEKLLNLEDLIHERMINQSQAVATVSDALRRAAAGVRSQNRPIGTFLFLGPTGVGKTELAKAISEVYFNGEDQIVRIDLNEYVRSEDVARLIADGADDPSSLTAQIMKKPFSVVLLDEIEKAHPQVLTTLLQLLDEGILRDIKNQEISFRDSIVIATSNAGAGRIREYIERGYSMDQFEKPFIDELISSNQFRPEFLNRFDEICVFKPLGKEELLQIIGLILKGVNKTLEPQKITVDVAEEAKELLVEAGYDPRLGARPMRRIVQKTVENLVAKAMLSNELLPGATLSISKEQIATAIGNKDNS